DNGDDETVDIQAGHAVHTDQTEQPAPDHSAHDTQGNVEEEPFAPLVDQLAPDETRDQAEPDPRDDRHGLALLVWFRVESVDHAIRPQQKRLRDCEAQRLRRPIRRIDTSTWDDWRGV